MYCIVTYDVNVERVNKVRQILQKYFMWVQNSVFEGEITEGKLEKCIMELKSIINEEEDSIYFYKLENKNNFDKQVVGIEKEMTSNIL
ncbi:MAG: CRISPR-associated endonuclease Cas2 [Caldimicrobium sp.]